MRRTVLTHVLLTLLFAASAPASAQVVRGRFTDVSATAPIEGGVVSLLAMDGSEVTSVLTDARGWYALRAPAPGRYRLRASRIGYADFLTEPFVLGAGRVLDRDIAAAVRAISLEGVTVRGTSRCRLRPDQGVQTQALWSAIRTALSAASLTKREQRLHYDVAEYVRDLDPATLRPLGPARARARSGVAEHPFVSAPVDELMRDGFVRPGPEQTSYFAPDADVLLSDAFLARHCFRVVADEGGAGKAGRVGLAFRPVVQGAQADVEGTLWVDPSAGELRALEYRYTGLDVPDAERLGGRVEFARVPTGRWIVSRWYVRMPVLPAPEPGRRLSDVAPNLQGRHLQRIIEQGGAIVGVRGEDGRRLYGAEAVVTQVPGAVAARAGTVLGRVVEAGTGRPLPSAQVLLGQGPDSAAPARGTLTGVDGSFAFGDVAPGDHRLSVESVGYEASTRVVSVAPHSGASVHVGLEPHPVELEKVVVEGHASTEVGGFYVRRARNEGYYLDRAKIERLGPRRPSDLMRELPDVEVICPGVSIRCSIRVPSAVPSPTTRDCPVQYFLDGRLMQGDASPGSPMGFSLDDLSASEIEAIEYYPHAAMVPARFNIGVSSRCGVVVVWTRGGPR